MKLIEKQKVSEWAIAPSIMPMKKVHYYSTVQIAQLMMIEKQKYRSGFCFDTPLR
jgi:hypothetical protein